MAESPVLIVLCAFVVARGGLVDETDGIERGNNPQRQAQAFPTATLVVCVLEGLLILCCFLAEAYLTVLRSTLADPLKK